MIRVSVSSDDQQANDISYSQSISADGRFVAFQSFASNLVHGDTNFAFDVFIHDCQSGVTERVSIDSNGGQAEGDSLFPRISADGRHVAFLSYASDLVPGDTNPTCEVPYNPGHFDFPCADVFVRDLDTGATVRVNVASDGSEANGFSAVNGRIAISRDGRFIAFNSCASNLTAAADLTPQTNNSGLDVFVHDRDPDGNGVFDESGAIETRVVDVDSSGQQASAPSAEWVEMTTDGRFVAFTTFANVIDGLGSGLFVFDRIIGTPARISIATDGTPAYGQLASFSANGRFVAFESPTSLVADDTNNAIDIFVHDRDADRDGALDEPGATTTIRASLDSANRQALGNSYSAIFSTDGRFVAFASDAANLVSDDPNGREIDEFIRDIRPCGTGNVNVGMGAATGVLRINGRVGLTTVGRGQLVEFEMDAPPLGPDPARYVVWVWPGLASSQMDLRVRGETLGCTVNPAPLSPSATPRAIVCVRGGVPVQACGAAHELHAAASAPWVLRQSQGFANAATFTLQGVIEDAGSANPTGFSVTNAVVLVVQ
ncbi:MAG: hypothetical protein HYR85_19950 [Planctomycetes bacterium]|nr:hypothetical protein [Planctomycetota bacterium]MBI3844503.1 hypothetical protein [Planctomycetota bacterium]